MPDEAHVKDALASIFRGINQLQLGFPERDFTIDGRLVGDLGEMIAWRHFDLQLCDKGSLEFDATTAGGRGVNIHATFQDALTFKTGNGYYLGLRLDQSGGHKVIFNGPAHVIFNHYRGRKGIGTETLQFPVDKLSELSRGVSNGERVSLRAKTES